MSVPKRYTRILVSSLQLNVHALARARARACVCVFVRLSVCVCVDRLVPKRGNQLRILFPPNNNTVYVSDN